MHAVNVADRWRERLYSYPGRSCRWGNTHSNNERQEVSKSHSTQKLYLGKGATLEHDWKMNVTEDRFKNRQPQQEGCSKTVAVEQRGYSRAFAYPRITETKDMDTQQQSDLLEQILHRDNLNEAYKRVKSNRGSAGIDGMKVGQMMSYLAEHKYELVHKLHHSRYNPKPVLRVHIPKPDGRMRPLGIPTAIDRMIQQAIVQVLSPIYERTFSRNSYGFRPYRSAHDALKACKAYVEEGYVYAIDMDLEKFFDTVNQSKLIEILSRTIKDGRVISLIHKYLQAGVVEDGVLKETKVGMPQGGNLSPLLSNIMLNELDKELERRGHKFVRYADDCMILCKSQRSAQRTLKSITKYIEQKLLLRVNQDKSTVGYIKGMKFLGYTFYMYRGECRFRTHPKSIAKMKDKLKELTGRSNGWGNEYRANKLKQFITGWINYFKLADMKSIVNRTDEWLRRRIRAIYWKQWKKVKTRYRMIKKYAKGKWSIHNIANCRKGAWASAMMLNSVLTKKEIIKNGFISMSDYYEVVCVN